MIIGLIFSAMFGLISALTSLFPSFTNPFNTGAGIPGSSWHDVYQVGLKAGPLQRYFALSYFMQILGWLITSFAVYVTIRIALWVYAKLPGKAS
jgi:hypothetical protein